MSKKILFILLTVMGSFTMFGQGIVFETGNWESILKKAKKEKKKKS